MDALDPRSLHVLEAVTDSNLLRLQVEQPELWTRLFVGDLVRHKTNLLHYARYLRASLQSVPGGDASHATPFIRRKRKAPVSPSSGTMLKLCCPTPEVTGMKSTPGSSGLGLSLSPFELSFGSEIPSSPLPAKRDSVLETRTDVPNTPPPFSFSVIPQPMKPGKENMAHLRIDTHAQPEDNFAAQQLVQLQSTPPSMPRYHKDPRSLSPCGQHDMLELLAKTCCQEKPETMSFFSFDADEARPKRFKPTPEPNKFDSLLLAVNNLVPDGQVKSKVAKSKSKAKVKGKRARRRSAPK